MKVTPHVVVIGAGIGGLTSAALLVKVGFRVTVLEAHIYPGGSAGTFFHQGYRFDAGATLAGGFFSGGPHHFMEQELGLKFPTIPADPAWVTHLAGKQVQQWQDSDRWQDEILHHFPTSKSFWRKQQSLADLSWKVSSKYFPYPPHTLREVAALIQSFDPHMIQAAPFLFAKVTDLLPKNSDPLLKIFLDAQLIISAQTTSERANALYASAALDLPRRGVKYISGGMGTLSKMLVDWIKQHGGEVLYRQQVTQIRVKNDRATALVTNKGLTLEADYVVANLTPVGLQNILPKNGFAPLSRQHMAVSPTWGAFVLYLGVDQTLLPPNFAYHQQVIMDPTKPLGEGNSVFVSISHPHDQNRAPQGKLAITCSTHTAVQPWWQWANHDPHTYEKMKTNYTEKVLTAVETVMPDVRRLTSLTLPGNPVTFQYYTRRPLGLVGGFPQESLLRVRGPKTNLRNVWLVGDSIFPGQSTAAVTIGAQRVVELVKHSVK